MKKVNLSGVIISMSSIPALLNTLSSGRPMSVIKKSILSAACFIAFTCVCFAQDVIVTKDSKKINAKVTEVNVDNIRFIKSDYLDGPVYTLPKSDIVAILYENGQTETFGAKSATSQPKPDATVASSPVDLPAGTEARNQPAVKEKPPVSFSEGSNWGLKDTAGNVIVAAKYARINTFSEGVAAVNIGGKSRTAYEMFGTMPVPVQKFEGGKWGFINTRGEVIVPCEYDGVENFSEGLAAVKQQNRYGFVDMTGKEVITCKFDAVGIFSEGMAIVKLKNRCGYIDHTGTIVIPCKYDGAGRFSEGMAMIRVKNRFGYVNRAGVEVIPCKYDDVDIFSEGLAAVKLKNRYGFVDKTGTEVIPCTYDYAKSFSEGLAVVSMGVKISKGASSATVSYTVFNGGKFGFIDTTGKEVIPVIYNGAESFKNGKAQVNLEGTFFINKEGNKIENQ